MNKFNNLQSSVIQRLVIIRAETINQLVDIQLQKYYPFIVAFHQLLKNEYFLLFLFYMIVNVITLGFALHLKITSHSRNSLKHKLLYMSNSIPGPKVCV